MAVIRNTKINIDALHRAKANLQANQPLNYDQRKVLLDLIQDGEKVLFPTQMERDRYLYAMGIFMMLSAEAEPGKYSIELDTASDHIIEFEEKYCKP